MAKKSRLGADPLDWIKDSRKEEDDDEVEEIKTKVVESQTLPEVNAVSRIKRSGRPKVTRDFENASQMGLRAGWTRATFIVREEFLEKLKNLSYWDRKSLKEILDELMEEHLKDKKVRSRPKRGG